MNRLAFAASFLFAAVASAEPVDPYSDSHDGKAPIQVSISGAIDTKVIGDSLAKELGREIREAGDACAAPCLTIIVGGDDKATIVFAATSGSIRQRTVTLGTDHAQWPVVITLLAGNLVRDEASDVLALVPKKVAPPTLTVPAAVDAPEPPAAPAPPKLVAAPSDDEEGDEEGDTDEGEDSGKRDKPAQPVESRTFAIGLFPIASTDLANTNRSHFLSLNIIVGVNAGDTGLALAGIADIEDSVSGVQISGVASLSDRVSGFQIGGVTSIADGVSGFQISGVASIADRVSGFQIGGAAAVSDDLSGVQIGGAAAVADRVSGFQAGGAVAVADRVTGFQAGGAVSVADSVNTQIGGAVAVSFGNANLQIGGAAASASGDADIQIGGAVAVAGGNTGVQVAGAVSVSDSADVQIAGAVAVTGHLTGVQIAPINVASCVDGLQLGVINIGGCPDGDSFGIINIVPGGRYDLEASIDSYRVGTLLMRHGGRHWHNVYGIGGHPVKQDDNMPNDDVWMYGAGLGPTFRMGGTVLDVEVIGWEVNHGWHHEADLSVLGQLRATLGIPLGFMTVVVGGAINTYVSTDQKSPFILERSSTPPDMTREHVTTTTWPSVFVGVRL